MNYLTVTFMILGYVSNCLLVQMLLKWEQVKEDNLWKWISSEISALKQTSVLKHRACCLIRSDVFVTQWAIACQVPLFMGFPRQEYWRGLSFPSPNDLPNPGIEPASSALAGEFFTTEPLGKPDPFQASQIKVNIKWV